MRPAATAAAALLAAGCACQPTAEDWQGLGFRSPEQTFGTLQTALSADLSDLAYRCLSEDFKRREGVVGMSFAIAWDRILAGRPWLRRLSCGEVIAREELPDGGVALRVAVGAPLWFDDVELEVALVPQPFRELWVEARKVDDAYLDPGEGPRASVAADGSTWLQAQQRVPSGVDPASITELRFGADWKIASFSLLSDPPPESASFTGAHR